jgi:hypothetical protein
MGQGPKPKLGIKIIAGQYPSNMTPNLYLKNERGCYILIPEGLQPRRKDIPTFNTKYSNTRISNSIFNAKTLNKFPNCAFVIGVEIENQIYFSNEFTIVKIIYSC